MHSLSRLPRSSAEQKEIVHITAPKYELENIFMHIDSLSTAYRKQELSIEQRILLFMHSLTRLPRPSAEQKEQNCPYHSAKM